MSCPPHVLIQEGLHVDRGASCGEELCPAEPECRQEILPAVQGLCWAHEAHSMVRMWFCEAFKSGVSCIAVVPTAIICGKGGTISGQRLFASVPVVSMCSVATSKCVCTNLWASVLQQCNLWPTYLNMCFWAVERVAVASTCHCQARPL